VGPGFRRDTELMLISTAGNRSRAPHQPCIKPVAAIRPAGRIGGRRAGSV